MDTIWTSLGFYAFFRASFPFSDSIKSLFEVLVSNL